MTWNIAFYYPFVMTGTTIAQFLAYLCYNRWFHPFKILVENRQPETEAGPTDMVQLVQIALKSVSLF